MKGQACNRCSGEARFTLRGLCAGCLQGLGFSDDPWPSRQHRPEYAVSYSAAATAERERILAIMALPESQTRWETAAKLAATPLMTAAQAITLLSAMPEAAPTGPAAEFAAVMAKAGPAPVDEQREVEQYLARVRFYESAMLAEQGHARRSKAGSDER